jgi:hypothetical protein
VGTPHLNTELMALPGYGRFKVLTSAILTPSFSQT